MKSPKLLKIVKKYLSSDINKQYEHINSFKEVLKKLKKKENGLKNKLKKETNEKNQKQIKKELAVIRAQRKKGIEAIKNLKKNSEL